MPSPPTANETRSRNCAAGLRGSSPAHSHPKSWRGPGAAPLEGFGSTAHAGQRTEADVYLITANKSAKPAVSLARRRRKKARPSGAGQLQRHRRREKMRDQLAATFHELWQSMNQEYAGAQKQYHAARNCGDEAAARLARRRIDELGRDLQKSWKFADLSRRVYGCHRAFRGYRCEARGHVWAEPINSCHVRLCPFDMRERAARALHRFRSVIDGLTTGKYAVFAERNCALGTLADGIKSLFEAWNRLRRHSVWAYVKGSLVVMELTFNREERTWHPHLNVIFDGPFLAFEQLRDAWIEATQGNGRTAYIKRADRGTARELIKYITKLADFVDIPEAVRDFTLSTKRRRFIRTYGTLYNIGLEKEEEGTRACPDCGDTDLAVWALCLHGDEVACDGRGVLRVPNAVWLMRDCTCRPLMQSGP